MKYREMLPGPAGQNLIEKYWILEIDAAGTGAIQRIVPDGRTELIINSGSPFQMLRNGRWELQPQCFFVGQITGPMLVRPSGPANLLGVRLRPHAAGGLVRL